MVAIKKKKSVISKAVKEEPKKTHARVTHKASGKETVIKDEKPLTQTDKHTLPYKPTNRIVGMNLGVTRNMDNYESLRVDVWATDEVKEGETYEDALNRVSDLVKARIDYEIEDILGE